MFSIFSCFIAKRNSELAVTINKKERINTPLAGSEAKACTEVNNPDLTINVPRSVKEKARIQSNMVHDFRLFLFSVTLVE